MGGLDIAAEVAALIEVATNEWLVRKRVSAGLENHLLGEDAFRRNRLRLLVSAYDRLAEVDAQLAIVEVTPTLPGREQVLRSLLQVRRELGRELRGQRPK